MMIQNGYFCVLLSPVSECNSSVVNAFSCTRLFILITLLMIKNWSTTLLTAKQISATIYQNLQISDKIKLIVLKPHVKLLGVLMF